MKLLMITGLGSAWDLASGKKGAFYNTLEEFSKYWERIDIICPRTNNEFSIFNFQINSKLETLFDNVYIHISPWPLIFHPIWFLKKALEIYKKQTFDLMTVHDFPPFYNGIGARLLWHKIKVPYVLEIHHIPGYPKAANLKEKIYRNLMRWFIKLDSTKAKAIRAVNQKQTPEFLKKAGIPTNKIIYIPSIYIDLNIFKPTTHNKPIRPIQQVQGYEFIEEQPINKEYDLIFVGRLEANKGVNLLLEVAEKFKIQNSKFKILIVGDGSLMNDLKQKTRDYKLETTICFYGWAKDSQEVAELLNRSKILVMPSYNEGGPRVIVEAMACGVPVLATPVGIVPDVLKNGQGGEIIAWEADDIARKASGLLHNPDRYQRYSRSGPEIAIHFEKEAAIKNYAEKLRNIIS